MPETRWTSSVMPSQAGRPAILSAIGQSAADGALPLLYAPTAREAEGGVYDGPDGIWELRGQPARADIARHAQDEAVAERLWSLSETLTGIACPV